MDKNIGDANSRLNKNNFIYTDDSSHVSVNGSMQGDNNSATKLNNSPKTKTDDKSNDNTYRQNNVSATTKINGIPAGGSKQKKKRFYKRYEKSIKNKVSEHEKEHEKNGTCSGYKEIKENKDVVYSGSADKEDTLPFKAGMSVSGADKGNKKLGMSNKWIRQSSVVKNPRAVARNKRIVNWLYIIILIFIIAFIIFFDVRTDRNNTIEESASVADTNNESMSVTEDIENAINELNGQYKNEDWYQDLLQQYGISYTEDTEETEDSSSQEQLSETDIINYSNMHFYINGIKYTLGESTIKDFLDNGLDIRISSITSNKNASGKISDYANKKLKNGNYISGYLMYGDDYDSWIRFTFINPEKEKTEYKNCVLRDMDFSTRNHIGIVSFDFPLSLSEEQFLDATQNIETYYAEQYSGYSIYEYLEGYADDNYMDVYANNRYTFQFKDGEFYEIIMKKMELG